MGCKKFQEKFLEIPGPTTSVNAENVYRADGTAIAVLTGFFLADLLLVPWLPPIDPTNIRS